MTNQRTAKPGRPPRRTGQRWRYFVAFLASCAAILWLSACNNGAAVPMVIPTPVVTPTVTPTATPVVYTVQPGDTVIGISNKFGIDAETLVKVNAIADVTLLQPGQQLLISDKVTASGTPLPTPTPTTEPCVGGCATPVAACDIKAFRARLDGTQMFVLPADEIYDRVPAELWFCQETRARAAGWVRWTAFGPEPPTPTPAPTATPTPVPPPTATATATATVKTN